MPKPKSSRGSGPAATSPGGAASVSPQKQEGARTPLLGNGSRSDSPGARKSPPSKGRSPTSSKPPKEERAFKCDQTTYLRLINYLMDMIECDTGYDDAKASPLAKLRGCLCCVACLAILGGLVFVSGPFVSAASEWLSELLGSPLLVSARCAPLFFCSATRGRK